jgi:hypothetical protein
MNGESLVDNNAENISRYLWQACISHWLWTTTFLFFVYLQTLIQHLVCAKYWPFGSISLLRSMPFFVLIFFFMAVGMSLHGISFTDFSTMWWAEMWSSGRIVGFVFLWVQSCLEWAIPFRFLQKDSGYLYTTHFLQLSLALFILFYFLH